MIGLIMTIHDDSHLSQTVRKFEIRQESIVVFFSFFLRGANVGIPGWEMHSCPTSNKLQGRRKSMDDFCLEQHILIILTYGCV